LSEPKIRRRRIEISFKGLIKILFRNFFILVFQRNPKEVFKIRKSHFLFFVLLISASFLLSSCAKAECKANADCQAQFGKDAACIDKQCKYTPKSNFCGNGIKDAIENGKQGNKCTCPADYGKCEGKGKIKRYDIEYDTQYLAYYCDERERCVFGVDKKDARPIDLIDERELEEFTIETKMTFNRPFDGKKDYFNFRVTLKDASQELVLPVKILKATVLGGEVLFGELQSEGLLNGIGDTANMQIPLTYVPEQIEEEKSLSYKIDYEYKVKEQQRLANGSYIDSVSAPKRNSFERAFRENVFLVKSGEAGG